MKIKAQQLASTLKSALHPVYLVTGDEPLLVNECCDSIRKACANQGFTEREKYQADKSFEWQKIIQSANSLSLFAEKKIIDMDLLQKPADKGKAIIAYLENPQSDTVLLLNIGKLDSATQKTAWYKAIDARGVVIPVWPIEGSALFGWIEQRLQQAGLTADREVIHAIIDRVEGNLLAAKQEIDKLSLSGATSPLTPETITDTVEDASRYTLYHLIDQCLLGNGKQAFKILHRLESEGMEWYLLIWHLAREFRTLCTLSEARDQGLSLEAAFKQQRIFAQKQPVYRQALQKFSTRQFLQLLTRAHKADLAIKGLHDRDPQLLIRQLILTLTV